MVSVPGDEADKARALEGLQSAAGFLRSRAARALTTRIGARAALRARPGPRARGPDRRAAERRSGGRSRTDRRGAGGQAGRDDVARRRSSGCGGCSEPASAGHTGTLDPFATGLLVVLVGRATRLARFVERQPKTYLATARLGVRTDTDDLTGADAGDAGAVRLGNQRVGGAAGAGGLRGRPAAAAARATRPSTSVASGATGWRGGVRPWSCPRSSVTVHRIELVEFRWRPRSPSGPTVSAGTYLRAIARDLGERLGVGAHLTALRREAIGPLRVEEAVPLDRLSPAADLRPARSVLGHLPAVDLDEAAAPAGAARPGGGGGGTAGQRGSGAVALLWEAASWSRSRGRPRAWLNPTVVLGEPVTAAAPRPAAPLPRLPTAHRDGRARSTGCTWGIRRSCARSRRRAGGRGARERAGDLRAASAGGGESAGRAAAADDRARAAARSWPSRRWTTCCFSGSTASSRRSRRSSSCAMSCWTRCAVRELVIGHDHGFGRGRSGDVETLRRLGESHGFDVDVVPPVDFGGQHVSSSRIRRAVAGGDLATAAAHAGPALRGGRPGGGGGAPGPVARRPDHQPERAVAAAKLLPPDGVYAVRVEWRGGGAGGMMNQGPRPTFQDGRRVSGGASLRVRGRPLRRVGRRSSGSSASGTSSASARWSSCSSSWSAIGSWRWRHSTAGPDLEST